MILYGVVVLIFVVGGVADPTQLPVATGQSLSTPGYLGLLASGDITTDPTTGVTIIRLTDRSNPTATNTEGRVHHAQVTGVSMPWGASNEMRTVAVMVRDTFTFPYLVDVNTLMGAVTNWRNMDSDWSSSDAATAIAFSPISSNIIYVASVGGQIRKWDTTTAAFLTEGLFPKDIPGLGRGSILFVSPDEDMFVVTKFNRQWFKYWKVSTDTVSCATSQIAGQGGLTPGGVYGWGSDEDGGSSFMIKVNIAGCIEATPSPAFRFSHPAGVGNFLVGGDPTRAGGPQMHFYDFTDDSVTELGTPGSIIAGSRHMAGNWVIGQPSPPWVMFSTFIDSGGKFLHAIGYMRLDGAAPDPRILCHTDSIQEALEFFEQPHAASSPDGKVVVWESNMNGSGNPDVFMAVVPTSKEIRMANEITAVEGTLNADTGVTTWELFLLFPISTPAQVGGSNVVPTPANDPVTADDNLPSTVAAVIVAAERTALNNGTAMFRIIGFRKEDGTTNAQLKTLARSKYAAQKAAAQAEYDARYEFAGTRINEV